MTSSGPAASSATRRMTYSFRSNASPSRPSARDDELADARRRRRAPSGRRARRRPGRRASRRAAGPPARSPPRSPRSRVCRSSVPTPYRPAGGRLVDLAAEERVRDLDEDPGAVARVRVGAGRAAVLEVRERDERPLDRLVARHPVQARDEGDAAGVVLERGVVQTGWTVRQGQLRRGEGVPPCGLVGGGGSERPTSAHA